MAWDEDQREAIVSVYIDGYKTGTHDACIPADRVLDLRKDAIPEHDNKTIVTPSGVCRVNATDYTRCDELALQRKSCTVYADIITAFYAKHPEYRAISFEHLMQFLTDKQHNSADDLFSMAKSGMISTSW